MPYDPLDGIENYPVEKQTVMLSVELRNLRNAMKELHDQLEDFRRETKADFKAVRHDNRWVVRGVWSFVGSLLVGLLLYLATHPPTA